MNDAFAAAVKLLSMRERSRASLSTALARKGFSAAEVDAACERAAALGYLDEARFAAIKLRSLEKRGLSKAALQTRLLGAGVAERTAEATVAERLDGQTDLDRARAALARRRELTGKRAAAYLSGRGFDEDILRALVPDAFDSEG